VPTRVLLEGPAIEPLLSQVRREYGSAVRIISADKVRSGGFGGFFAKQHYELSVEVPDMDEEPPAFEEPAQTLDQMLERAEAGDRVGGPDEKQSGREAGIEDTVGRCADGADAAAQHFQPDSGAAFAELLAGLDTAHHIATSGPARPAPRPEVTVDKTDNPTVRPFRPTATTGTPINGTGTRPLPPVPSLAELMGGLGLAGPETPPATPPARSAAAAYGLNPAPAPPLTSVHNDPVIGNLISVGMPDPIAAQITGGDTYAGVLSVLAARPAAPGIPDGPGEILVLAGDLSHAVPTGKQLLAQIGADQSHLLLAGASAAGTGVHSSRVLHDPETAAARAEKLQNANSAWVVVLDAPIGATDPLWVNDMCDAFGATALWAVVDATRKTADTARHLRMLGEVEALVVHNVGLTADPATVLGLDLPIFSLDGKPATPHAWAAMLCARIAADVTPAAAPRRIARSVRR
jgi:hypothetical protein